MIKVIYPLSKNPRIQGGFALLEVLVAMFIAALAVASVILIHNQNLYEVSGNAELARAQVLLNNMGQRIELNVEGADAGFYNSNSPWSAGPVNKLTCFVNCSPLFLAQSVDIPAWRNQVFESGFVDAQLSVTPNANGFLLQVDWAAHDAFQAVWRSDCGASVVGRHCVALQVRP